MEEWPFSLAIKSGLTPSCEKQAVLCHYSVYDDTLGKTHV